MRVPIHIQSVPLWGGKGLFILSTHPFSLTISSELLLVNPIPIYDTVYLHNSPMRVPIHIQSVPLWGGKGLFILSTRPFSLPVVCFVLWVVYTYPMISSFGDFTSVLRVDVLQYPPNSCL